MTRASTLIATVSIAVIALVVGGCGSTSGGKYEEHGVSLQIPDGWKTGKVTLQTNTGNELWSKAFAPAEGPDLVALTAYPINQSISADNIAAYESELSSFMADLAQNSGGSVTDGPTSVTMGGLPGFRFEASFPDKKGTLESRIMMVFKGKTEYYLNCQHRSDSSRAAEIESGCNSIADSFELTGA